MSCEPREWDLLCCSVSHEGGVDRGRPVSAHRPRAEAQTWPSQSRTVTVGRGQPRPNGGMSVAPDLDMMPNQPADSRQDAMLARSAGPCVTPGAGPGRAGLSRAARSRALRIVDQFIMGPRTIISANKLKMQIVVLTVGQKMGEPLPMRWINTDVAQIVTRNMQTAPNLNVSEIWSGGTLSSVRSLIQFSVVRSMALDDTPSIVV
jgi:hypothetical protein